MNCRLVDGVGVIAERLLAIAVSLAPPALVAFDLILQTDFWTGAVRMHYYY